MEAFGNFGDFIEHSLHDGPLTTLNKERHRLVNKGLDDVSAVGNLVKKTHDWEYNIGKTAFNKAAGIVNPSQKNTDSVDGTCIKPSTGEMPSLSRSGCVGGDMKWFPRPISGVCLDATGGPSKKKVVVDKTQSSTCLGADGKYEWVSFSDSQTDKSNLQSDYNDANIIMKQLFIDQNSSTRNAIKQINKLTKLIIQLALN